jgi:DNA-binding HxlR family transcriptional regulator
MLGGKWRLLIIQQLRSGPQRLSELRRLIPDISEKMLIQELKYLIQNDLVLRENFGEVPPRVEYKLSKKGTLVFPLIEEMVRFAGRYSEEGQV